MLRKHFKVQKSWSESAKKIILICTIITNIDDTIDINDSLYFLKWGKVKYWGMRHTFGCSKLKNKQVNYKTMPLEITVTIQADLTCKLDQSPLEK